MPAKLAICAVATMAFLMQSVFCDPASAQERWAAIAPNNEATSPIVWAATKEQAKRIAIDACKGRSSTCSKTPASTNDMSHVFAIMCCTRPKVACAAAVASTPKSASRLVKKTLSEANYSNCKLKHHIKAGTGVKN